MKDLYFFHAEGCAPCKVIEPWAREMAAEHRWNFITVDVQVDIIHAQKFGVTTLPTILLVQDGYKVLRRVVGACTKFDLEMKLT